MPPPNGAPPTSAPSAGSSRAHILKPWRNQGGGGRQHRTTHLSSLAAPETDPFGLASAVESADLRGVEPSGVNAHERGGAQPVAGTAPALAEGTAGVEPAGETKIATAAKLEALVPWAQGETGREVVSLPQEGKAMYEPPPDTLPLEGRCNHEPPPQKGGRKQGALPQKRGRGCPNEGRARTRNQGAATKGEPQT